MTGRHVAQDRPGVIAALTPERRRHLYAVTCAVIPLLTSYGIVAAHEAPLWLALALAVLGLGTATAHTGGGDASASDDR